MKGQVAAEVAAAVALGEQRLAPAQGELLLVITADEEVGGGLGAHWLCEQHPDKVRADFVVNEGGGDLIELGGRRLYTLSVGEKGIFRMKLRAHGRAGHASVPRIGDNALLKLARLHRGALRAAASRRRRRSARLCSRRCSASPSPGEEGIRAGLERLRAEQPLIADFLVEPMLSVTLTPTIAQGGQEGERHPLRGRGADRLPRAARVRQGRGARGAASADRRGRLHRRVQRGGRRQQLPARLATVRTRSASGSARSTPARGSRRS